MDYDERLLAALPPDIRAKARKAMTPQVLEGTRGGMIVHWQCLQSYPCQHGVMYWNRGDEPEDAVRTSLNGVGIAKKMIELGIRIAPHFKDYTKAAVAELKEVGKLPSDYGKPAKTATKKRHVSIQKAIKKPKQKQTAMASTARHSLH